MQLARELLSVVVPAWDELLSRDRISEPLLDAYVSSAIDLSLTLRRSQRDDLAERVLTRVLSDIEGALSGTATASPVTIAESVAALASELLDLYAGRGEIDAARALHDRCRRALLALAMDD